MGLTPQSHWPRSRTRERMETTLQKDYTERRSTKRKKLEFTHDVEKGLDNEEIAAPAAHALLPAAKSAAASNKSSP